MSKSKDKGSFLSKIRQKSKEKVDPELQEFIRTVQDDPDDMRARLKLADAYLKREDRLRALDQYLTVAETYAAKGFYPKAVAVYKQALAIDPQMIEVYIKLASQYQKLGLMGEVVAQYTKAASIHEKAGRKKEAIDVFRMLIDLSPDNAVGRLKLGQRYLKEGFETEAVAEFLKTADIFDRQGKTEDRKKLLESLLDKGIEDMRIIHPLMVIYQTGKRHDQVLARLGSLRGDLAGSATVQEFIAHSNLAIGQRGRALVALENVARLYGEARRPDKQIDAYREILEIDASHEAARAAVEAFENDRAAQAEARRVREEAERAAAQAEADVDIEIDLEEPEAEREFEIEPEAEEMPVAAAVEEDVWATDRPDAADAEEPVDLFGSPEPTPSGDAIPMMAGVEHGFEHDEHGSVADHRLELESHRHEPDEDRVDHADEPDTAEPAGVEFEDVEPLEIGAVDTEAGDEEVDLFSVDEPDLFADAEPEVEAEPEIEIESEPDLFAEVEDEEPEAAAEAIEDAAGEQAPEEDEGDGVDLFGAADDAAEETAVAESVDARTAAETVEAILEEPGEAMEEAAVEEAAPEPAPEPEPEPSPEEQIPEVDWATLDAAAARDHLAFARLVFEDAGQIEGYDAYLQHAHHQNPDATGPLEGLRSRALETGDEDASLTYLYDLVEATRKSGDTGALVGYLNALVAEAPGDKDAVEQLAEALRASDPERAFRLFADMARVADHDGDERAALGYWDRALAVDPDNEGALDERLALARRVEDEDAVVTTLRRLAAIRVASDNDAAAKTALEELARLQPDDTETRNALLDVYGRLGDTEASVTLLVRMGRRAAEAGEDDEAIARLGAAVEIDADNVLAREALRDVYVRSGDTDAAIEQLTALAGLALAAGRARDAESLNREAIALDPSRESLRLALAEALAESGRESDASQEWVAIAEARAKAGDQPGTGEALAQAVSLAPAAMAVRRKYIDYLKKAGRGAEAADQLFQAAEHALRAGKPNDAVAAWRDVLAADPSNRRAHNALKDHFITSGDSDAAVAQLFQLAEQARKAQDAAEALAFYGEIVGLDSENVRARRGIVDLHLAGGNVDAAVGELVTLARLDLAAGRTDDAATTLQQVLKLQPDDREALETLGAMYVQTGRPEKAIELLLARADRMRKAERPEAALSALDEVLALDPASVTAFERRRDILAETGDTAGAAESLHRLTAVHRQAGRTKEAEAALREILRLVPGDVAAREALAELYVETVREDKAAEQWRELLADAQRAEDEERLERYGRRLLDIDPEDTVVLAAFVNRDAAAGRTDEAVAGLYRLAAAHQKSGETHAALDALRRAAHLLPDSMEPVEKLLEFGIELDDASVRTEAHLEAAARHQAAGRVDEALIAATEAVQADPDNVAALGLAVDLCDQAGRPADAIPSLFRLAEIAKGLGDSYAAEERLEHVLRLDENNLDAVEKLSQIHLGSGDTEKASLELFRLARAAEDAGDDAKALEHLDRIELIDAANVPAMMRRADLLRRAARAAEADDALLRLALTLREADRTDKAVEALREVLAHEARHVAAHKTLCEILVEAGRPADVVAELARYANEAREAGDLETAIASYEQAVGIEPGGHEVLTALAQLREQAGETEAAAQAWLDVARAANEAGQLERREEALRRVIALDALNGEAQLALRTHYLDTDRTAEAIELASDYALNLRLAELFDRAEVVYRDIQRVAPGSVETADALVELAMERGDPARAVALLGESIERAERDGDTARLLALLRRSTGIDPLQPETWDRIVAVHVENGDAANAVSDAFQALEALNDVLTPTEIENRLNAILRIDDGSLRAWRSLADLHRRLGNDEAYTATALELAERLTAAGDADAAQSTYEDVIAADPRNVTALRRLAAMAREAGQTDRAADMGLRAAGVLVEFEDWEGALAEANALLDLDRHMERALVIARDAHRGLGNESEATQAERRLAVLAADSEDWTAAEEALRHLIAQDPQDIESRERLADVLAREGKTAEAAREWLSLADMAERAEDMERTRALVRRVAEADPGNVTAFTRLLALADAAGDDAGRDEAIDALLALHKERGDTDAVEALMHRRLIASPDDAALREDLARLYIESGEYDKASLFLFDEAETAQAEDRIDDAVAAYRRVVEFDPHNEAAHRHLFELFKGQGRKDEAAESLLALVDHHLQSRRFHTAEKHLHTIFALDPANKAAKERLADLFIQSQQLKEQVETLLRTAERALGAGQNEEARARLDEALSLDPENPEAKNLLNALYYRQPKVTRREVGAIFEDVEIEYQDQGDIDIGWGEDGRATDRKRPGAEERVAAEAGDVDLFGGAEESVDLFGEGLEAPAAADTGAEVVDIFGSAPGADDELNEEEAAIAAAAETADAGVDVFAAESAADTGDDAGSGGDVDLFGAEDEAARGEEPEPETDLFAETVEREESAPETAESAAAESEELDLFGEAGANEPIESTRSTEAGGEKDLDLFAEIREESETDQFAETDEPLDLFAESPQEETLEESASEPDVLEEEIESAESERQSRGIGELLLDEIMGEAEEPGGGDFLDSFIQDLEGGSGAAHEGSGDPFDDLAAEFKAMLGDEAERDAQAHYSVGIAFREIEQTEEAIAEFEKALALGDTALESQISYQLAQCYVETEQWDQAAEYLAATLDAIEEHGGEGLDRLDVMMDLGLAEKALGKIKKALATFQAVDAENANYRGVKAEIRSLKKQSGEDDEGPDNISFM